MLPIPPAIAFYLLFRTFAFIFESYAISPSQWDDDALPNNLSSWIIHEYTYRWSLLLTQKRIII